MLPRPTPIATPRQGTASSASRALCGASGVTGEVVGRQRNRRQTLREVLEDARSRRGVALMGVCNVTPDSFSDGGLHFSLDQACARGAEVRAEGAGVSDGGGESTRPGAQPVPAKEQLARVLEVVRYAASKVGGNACVSIDTT